MFLSRCYFNCKYGNFIYNSEQERIEKKLHLKTPSVWNYVKEQKDRFLYPLYKPHSETIIPSTFPQRILLWEGFFLNWDSICDSVEQRETALQHFHQKKSSLENKLTSLVHLEEVRGTISSTDFDLAHCTIRTSDEVSVLKRSKSGSIFHLKSRPELLAELALAHILEKVFHCISENRKKEDDSEAEFNLSNPRTSSTTSTFQLRWKPSDNVKNCFKCGTIFTWWRRKHHCIKKKKNNLV